MSPHQHVDVLIIGSGGAGKNLAWSMAESGRRTAVVERKLIGGACPNIACLPSKNIIYSAKVAIRKPRIGSCGMKTKILQLASDSLSSG